MTGPKVINIQTVRNLNGVILYCKWEIVLSKEPDFPEHIGSKSCQVRRERTHNLLLFVFTDKRENREDVNPAVSRARLT